MSVVVLDNFSSCDILIVEREMKMKNLFIIFFFVITGCAQGASEPTEQIVTKEIREVPGDENTEEIRIVVISAYEEVMGVEIGLEERNKLAEVVVRFVTLDELRESFPDAPASVLGKSTGDGIWIRSDIDSRKSIAVAVHEYIHSLGRIMTHNGDDCHINTSLFTCADSVENKAVDWLDVENSYNPAYQCGVNSCK